MTTERTDTPEALVNRFFADWARSAEAQELLQNLKNSPETDDLDDPSLTFASAFLDDFLIPSLDGGRYPELLPWRPEDFGAFGRDAEEFYEELLYSAAEAADQYLDNDDVS